MIGGITVDGTPLARNLDIVVLVVVEIYLDNQYFNIWLLHHIFMYPNKVILAAG